MSRLQVKLYTFPPRCSTYISTISLMRFETSGRAWRRGGAMVCRASPFQQISSTSSLDTRRHLVSGPGRLGALYPDFQSEELW